MAQTTFSGPVKSDNGFLAPSYTLTEAAAIAHKQNSIEAVTPEVSVAS